jgi:hypothetical protein
MSIVLKSASLNLLEPYGPVKGCNGIDLPLTLSTKIAEVSKATYNKRRLTYAIDGT